MYIFNKVVLSVFFFSNAFKMFLNLATFMSFDKRGILASLANFATWAEPASNRKI